MIIWKARLFDLEKSDSKNNKPGKIMYISFNNKLIINCLDTQIIIDEYEISKKLKIKQHVIRYWDSQFDGISTRLGERKRRYFSSKNIKK